MYYLIKNKKGLFVTDIEIIGLTATENNDLVTTLTDQNILDIYYVNTKLIDVPMRLASKALRNIKESRLS